MLDTNEREQRLLNEPIFEASLKAASQDNYLGDPQILQSLLRFNIGEFIEKFTEADTPDDRKSIMQRIARKIGSILLGKNDDYIPQSRWNRSGAIDEFAAKWLGSAETDPEERMEHAVVKMFNEILELADYVGEPGVLDEQWIFQFDELLSRYTNIFLGIEPSITTALMLGQSEPEPLNEEE